MRRRRLAPFRKALRWYSYAAAALLVPLAAGIALYMYSNDRRPQEYAELVVPQGQRDSIRLADNTLVWLNAGSRLIYPDKFSDKDRKVYLTGEAFFQVEKDSRRPFIVSAGEVSVRVLGTKFNFSTYEDSESVYVSLVQGSVRLESERSGVHSSVMLVPGDIVRYHRLDGVFSRASGSAAATANWMDGGFYFNDRPLDEIIRSFERSFNVRITLTDTSIGKERYSLAFVNNETVDQIMSAIAYNGRLSVSCKDGEYSLSRRK